MLRLHLMAVVGLGFPSSPASKQGAKAPFGTSRFSLFPLLPAPRYAIDRSTDTERIFDIDANTGAIVTGKVLDRETAGWHNITILAMEAGEQRSSCLGWTTV